MDEINASENCHLGCKEYWEDFYSKELENFREYGDEGDVWFGTRNVDRIVKWLLDKNIDKHSSILDVGCGNGFTLVSLGKKGFTDLTGIDYADDAIQLAENVAKSNNVKAKFEVINLLGDNEDRSNFGSVERKFDIIIDKGTYDAICLCPQNKREQYVKKIRQLLAFNGYFILFSCNWTKEELLNQFMGFEIFDEIENPSIGFGGKTGQTVTAVILK